MAVFSDTGAFMAYMKKKRHTLMRRMTCCDAPCKGSLAPYSLPIPPMTRP